MKKFSKLPTLWIKEKCYPHIAGNHRKLTNFGHHQSQNNWKLCFEFISVYGSDWDMKSQDCCLLSLDERPPPVLPPFLGWDEARTSPPPPPYCSVGGVMMVRSDYNYWVQMKGSSVFTCWHMGLWLVWFSPHHLNLQYLNSSTSTEKEQVESFFGLPLCLLK